MVKIKKALNLWLPVLLWGVVIFLFSNRPTIQTTDIFIGDFILKKSAHLFEYGILATLIYRALINSGVEKKKAMWISVLSCFLYGVSDEYHQSFIDGRTSSIRDVLIDTTGATIFIYGVIRNLKGLPESFKYRIEKFIFIQDK